MVDRVYGQPSTEALAGLAEAKLLTAPPLLIGYNDVTVKPSTEENPAEAPVAQWIEQRFPKPLPHHELDAGILGFRRHSALWMPPYPGGGGGKQGSSGTPTSHGAAS